MAVKYTNNASSTIASGINSSATTITLATGEGAEFPTLSAGDYFYGTLVDANAGTTEIVKVTARSSDTLTVVRGQDSTTAASWGAGTRFDLRVCAALLTDLAPVSSVAGKTGAVSLVKADVGLGNVDNTSDADKPVSTATQTALDAKQPLDADLTSIAGLAGTTGLLKKTAANTWALDTTAYLTGNQSISFSGDATGSGTTSVSLTLANSGATAGTYKSVTVDAKGRVTGGTNPTTLSGYGITDAQALDADLTAIAALAGTSGLLKKTATDTWSLDTSTYLTSAVTSVSGTAPIVSSGGNTPAISISAATTSAAGSMSATDKAKLDGIASGATANTGTVTSVTGTAPISVATGTSTPAISISAATTAAAGSMSAADKSKLDGIASGATANTGTVTSVGGTGTVSGISLSGTVTSSGNLSLSGTLVVTPSNFASQTANQILAAPNGTAGVPTFRAIVAADIPTLNQDTTGSSGSCTGNAASASSVPWSGVTSKPTTLSGYGITDATSIPAGTAMLFVQTTAPTGWTKSTSHDNKTLRVVSGTASSGGTSAFTTVFASRTPTGSVGSSFSSGSAASTTATGTVSVSGGSVSATTLDATQIPSHQHAQVGNYTQSTTHSHAWGSGAAEGPNPSNGPATNMGNTGATGGGGSHTHSFTTPTASFTGTAHSHTVSGTVSSSFSGSAMDFAVQYVDVIIATKN